MAGGHITYLDAEADVVSECEWDGHDMSRAMTFRDSLMTIE
jgi:hypothetical protein